MAAKAAPGIDGATTEKPKRKFSIKKLIMFLLIMGLLSGGACAAYVFIFSDSPGNIKKTVLPKDIIKFTYIRIPEVHTGMMTISDEIIMTETEIDRIDSIEKTFPDQSTITGSEKKIWKDNLDSLMKVMSQVETEVKIIYVSWRVNQEIGTALIDEKKNELIESIEAATAPSRELTDKLRAREEAKGFFEKTRDKLFK